MKPKLLDLFCGAGGASVGYARAGFDVTGVDIEDHPSYPFRLMFSDITTWVWPMLCDYDVVHASPPCQVYTSARHLRDAQGKTTDKPDLLEFTRDLLATWASDTGGTYVIENVPGAPLVNPVQMCGSAFGLKVQRHRLFESNALLLGVECAHKDRPVGIYGSMRDDIPSGGRTASSIEEAREAMGIDWMQWRSVNQEWNDLKEAIPPAYTEHLGVQLLDHVAVAS